MKQRKNEKGKKKTARALWPAQLPARIIGMQVAALHIQVHTHMQLDIHLYIHVHTSDFCAYWKCVNFLNLQVDFETFYARALK